MIKAYLRTVNRMAVFEKFIAGRLYASGDRTKGGTRPAVIIAMTGVAMGLAVMILTLAITRGFRHQVSEKVTGFSQDIRVINYDVSMGEEELPVSCMQWMLDSLNASGNITHAQRFAAKAGLLRTDSTFQGFLLKGVGQEFDFSFMESCLLEGTVPECTDTAASGRILISKKMADILEVSVGDRVDACFMQEHIRARKFEVSGIYQTNFSEYDRLYAITDIYTLQKLNGWEPYQVTGVEVRAANNDEDPLYDAYLAARNVFNAAADQFGERYLIQTTQQLNAGLFAWLDVLNVNVGMILLLMMGIAGFTIISGLLIIIFERTSTIGILKAMGASDSSIRKTFLILASRIVLRGMLLGNVIGVALCLIQQKFRLVPLDPENYYLDSVPCELQLWWLVLLNIVTFVLSVLMLVGPSSAISRVKPSKSIRFE